MQGTRADPGVLPQALHMIFEEVRASIQPLAVRVSHYEVLCSRHMHELPLQPCACHVIFLLFEWRQLACQQPQTGSRCL